MGEHKNYRDESKKNYGSTSNEGFTLEQINCGSLQRIADASEKMAENFVQLQKNEQFYREGYYRKSEEINNLNRRINGYKGKIQQLKNKKSHEQTPNT